MEEIFNYGGLFFVTCVEAGKGAIIDICKPKVKRQDIMVGDELVEQVTILPMTEQETAFSCY